MPCTRHISRQLPRSLLCKPSTVSSIRNHPHRSAYHSPAFTTPPPYPSAESSILSAALAHVPSHGFTQRALGLGAQDAGYLEVSANLFPRGEFEIVLYHLVRERGRLGERVQFLDGGDEGGRKLDVGQKIKALVVERLRANIDAGVDGRWGEVCAVL